ncbi:hypothetical protein WMY93_029964 [Mugilogobius chulae]|uniref:non-specific serine/threonine protein kinase n=1 Tax=Mugilogobius chulae TaxID=88201 RepID=A0AAW0MQ08_9GOBI
MSQLPCSEMANNPEEAAIESAISGFSTPREDGRIWYMKRKRKLDPSDETQTDSKKSTSESSDDREPSNQRSLSSVDSPLRTIIEEAALENDSSGPRTRLSAAKKRRLDFYKTQKDCKRAGSQSSDDAKPSDYSDRRPKKKTPMIKKLKPKIAGYVDTHSECGGSSSTEGETVFIFCKPSTSVDNEPGSSHVLDNEPGSSHVLDSEARSSHVLDSEARSSHVLDNEPGSSHVLDSEARSSHVLDNEPGSSHVLDSEARSSNVLESNATPSHVLDSNAGPSHVLNTVQAQKQELALLVMENKSKSMTTCDPFDLTEKDQVELYTRNYIEFVRKYTVYDKMKVGGCGVVYKGIRREDNLPVAIKRLRACNCEKILVMENGKKRKIPLEVAILIKLGAGPGQQENNMTPLLLDWYEIGSEITMVLERPEPCMDLVEYINSLPKVLSEHDVKVSGQTLLQRRGMYCDNGLILLQVIFRQLVNAAINMVLLGVFHRDIKPDNILIETGHSPPRARFIDFGCGVFFSPFDIVLGPCGTNIYASPESIIMCSHSPVSSTVWQLGATLYCMLNCKRPFGSVDTVCSSYQPPIRIDLSEDCKDFLRRLLDKNPETRISLDKIKDHPWMN